MSLSEGEDSPFNEGGSYRMRTETVEVFSVKVPESFTTQTETELEAYNDAGDDTKLIAAFEHTSQDVGILVFRTPTDLTNDEMVTALLAENNSEMTLIERSGLTGVLLKGEDTSQSKRYEMTVVYFVADGNLYQIMYSCSDSAAETWGGAADAVMQSVTLLSADAIARPAA